MTAALRPAPPSAPAEAVLRTVALTKIYRMGEMEVPALRGIDLEGLHERERVVVYPSDNLDDGIRVEGR